MRNLILAVGTILCFTGPAVAQPAPSPPPTPPEAVSPAAAQGAARSTPAPAARPTSVAPPSSSGSPASFGPPSQLEPPGGPQPESRPAPRRLSETTALSLSLGGTALSWATLALGAKVDNEGLVVLGVIGTLLTPNMGHWYRGSIVTRGTVVRVVGLGLVGYFLMNAIGCEGPCDEWNKYFYSGFLLYIAATIDDIVTAPLRVRKHNQRLDAIGLTPVIGNHSAGLALGGRF